MKNLNILLLLFCTVIIFNSCKKNDNDDAAITQLPDINVTIAGQVINENKQPVQGAAVTAYGTSTITDAFGLFVIKNITIGASRCLVQIKKAGYINQYYAFKPTKAGRTLFARPVLIAEDAAILITAATGGTVALTGGATVTFPANAFVIASSGAPYGGNVSVRLDCLNQNDSLYARKVPGRDMRAIDADNHEKILEPFGMVNTLLTSASGEALQLATGKQATVTLPIATAQAGHAPATIALWYFDESSMVWKQEGNAARQGNSYQGTVSHFTWWSASTPYAIATMTGVAYNSCYNQPQANAEIFADYFYACNSDNLGEYICDAPAQYPYAFPVSAGYYGNITGPDFYSQTELVPVLTAGQVYTLPDLLLTPDALITYVSGNIVDASGNPTQGFVTVTDGAEVKDYTYTTTGYYYLACYSPSTVTVAAYDAGLYGHAAVNVPASSACYVVPVGNISMTNSVPFTNPNLSITLTGFVFGTQTLNYHVTECHVIEDVGYSTISFYGYDSISSSSASFELTVPAYATGSYAWGSMGTSSLLVTISLNSDIIEVSSGVNPPSGSSVITMAQVAGGNTAASFSGNVIATSMTLGSMTGSITGNFDIYRVD